jgi:hypothetical protein
VGWGSFPVGGPGVPAVGVLDGGVTGEVIVRSWSMVVVLPRVRGVEARSGWLVVVSSILLGPEKTSPCPGGGRPWWSLSAGGLVSRGGARAPTTRRCPVLGFPRLGFWPGVLVVDGCCGGVGVGVCLLRIA